MSSPIGRVLAGIVWTCTLCGSTSPCDCWARYHERALAYIASVAEHCGCAVPGGDAAACGCSPVCECHCDEDTAAERGALL